MELQDSSQKMLQQFVEQIERLEADKADLSRDIRDKYTEAESQGFDKKVLRKVVSLRKKSKAELEEEETLTDTYMAALGMLDDK